MVDSAIRKRELTLSNVLLIESMQFNIFSLQRVLATGYIYTFNLIPGKAVVQKTLPTGAMEQVALFSQSKQGRLTLDCTMSTSLPTLPSTGHAEVFVNTLSMDLLHRRLGHSGEASLHRLLREDMAT